MIPTIAHALQLLHNIRACESTQAGFDSPKLQAGRTATIGGIFSSQAMKPSMGGVVGGGNPCRVPVAGLSTRHCRPPTGLTAGASGVTATTGAPGMAKSAHVRANFPFTSTEAAHAARLWFVTSRQTMSMAEWRDHFRDLHLDGLRCDGWRERLERTAAWNAAFNDGVAAVIAGGKEGKA